VAYSASLRTSASWTDGNEGVATVSEPIDRVRGLLHEAAETHHQVYRLTDGADDDWASWYADWLSRLSELPELLGRRPVRSELTHYLVALDKEYVTVEPAQPWEEFYAQRLIQLFA
jgi:hypothetical protein